MVDAIDLELLQELADVGDGVGLVDVGVGGEEETFAGGALVDGGEFRGRVVALIGLFREGISKHDPADSTEGVVTGSFLVVKTVLLGGRNNPYGSPRKRVEYGV